LIQTGVLGEDSQVNRVYSPNGLSPTLPTPSGGRHMPKIVADRSRHDVGKGRNLEAPKDFTNALSSVQKDNLLVTGVTLANTTRYKTANRTPFKQDNESFALNSAGDQGVDDGVQIRRLTPTECERLQGFPDDWTKYGLNHKSEIVEISDTQRYKCLGNAVTTNVITFLGSLLLKTV
jgi:DNA (cytosine-5)-methyltransferase 1